LRTSYKHQWKNGKNARIEEPGRKRKRKESGTDGNNGGEAIANAPTTQAKERSAVTKNQAAIWGQQTGEKVGLAH